MDTEFFKAALAGGGATATLLLIAGYLGRTQLAHWLNRDIEAIKARHQRDLESYKVALIATVERTKAAQEVKRAGAVKILEMEFAAIQQLEISRRNLASDTLARANLPTEHKTSEAHSALIQRIDKYREAAALLGIFLTREQRKALLDLRAGVLDALRHCQPGKPSLEGPDFETLQTRVFELDLAIDSMISDLVKRMQSLD